MDRTAAGERPALAGGEAAPEPNGKAACPSEESPPPATRSTQSPPTRNAARGGASRRGAAGGGQKGKPDTGGRIHRPGPALPCSHRILARGEGAPAGPVKDQIGGAPAAAAA
ncbi:hypothetical protein SHIRM173S_04082 [Streptomyces hirsutus]